MPSPLSPAKRTTTASCGGCAVASLSVMRWVAVATKTSPSQTREFRIATLLGAWGRVRHPCAHGERRKTIQRDDCGLPRAFGARNDEPWQQARTATAAGSA